MATVITIVNYDHTVITIINYDRTVITIVNCDRKTFIVQTTESNVHNILRPQLMNVP
jgi:hypothetical protein